MERFLNGCIISEKKRNIYYKAKNICTEDIMRMDFPIHISRPTIFKIIDNAVTKDYLKKEHDIMDHRRLNLLPTLITITEFEKWAEVYKGF